MSATLTELSAELAAVVVAASPSIVRVEGRRRTTSSGVVWTADGVVVASHHALDFDENVPVGLPDGRSVAARVVGRDPGSDLAVLRAEASGLAPARWATATARVGEVVVSLSRPGRSARARLGIVSAAGGEWRTPAGGRLESYLETDVALHPGFSGGLLASASGEALGVNSAGLLRGGSLSVPGPAVRRVVESLLARGRVRRGWLGIGTQPVALPAELRSRLGQPAGLIVLSVQADSPAAKAGLLLGDVLLRAGEQPLTSPAALLPCLDEDRVGQALALSLLRAGEERGLVATVGEREAA
ncbi:MAG TPA: trypsin-like peptidase domain-containing protein [Solirubrobacteraceae bacterium]|nr:trypsin-like peptidase domain-containing protein [Solirubrobacteraceae bacterium]